jgi:hypothetical protein
MAAGRRIGHEPSFYEPADRAAELLVNRVAAALAAGLRVSRAESHSKRIPDLVFNVSSHCAGVLRGLRATERLKAGELRSATSSYDLASGLMYLLSSSASSRR